MIRPDWEWSRNCPICGKGFGDLQGIIKKVEGVFGITTLHECPHCGSPVIHTTDDGCVLPEKGEWIIEGTKFEGFSVGKHRRRNHE